jgi:hypothetical protein
MTDTTDNTTTESTDTSNQRADGEPLAVERFERHREGGNHHSFTIGTAGAGKSFSTKAELLAGIREDSESGKHTANDRWKS